MIKPALMAGLGEVLWDLLPSGQVLGGAPTNFAYMATVLGNHGVVASRVGSDQLGRMAQRELEQLGLSTAYIQQDLELQTGVAAVSIDSAGQPTFTIAEDVAWDCLQWTSQWNLLAAQCDVLCFGSLAQRAPESAETIDRFLRSAKPDSLRIFDANLRQSYYSVEIMRRSLEHANVVKLTDHELSVLASMLPLEGVDEVSLARQLIRQFDLQLVCVTRGARGSLLIAQRESFSHPGFPVQVVDAVGAGDAFTACLAHCLVRGYSLERTSGYANRFASWVATQVGATPAIDQRQLQLLLGDSNAVSELDAD